VPHSSPLLFIVITSAAKPGGQGHTHSIFTTWRRFQSFQHAALSSRHSHAYVYRISSSRYDGLDPSALLYGVFRYQATARGPTPCEEESQSAVATSDSHGSEDQIMLWMSKAKSQTTCGSLVPCDSADAQKAALHRVHVRGLSDSCCPCIDVWRCRHTPVHGGLADSWRVAVRDFDL